MSYWTTEEVADFLEISVAQVYESRKRKEYPGVLGRQRGRRLLFSQDLVEAGPQEPEVTDDVSTAILWALQGIKKALDAMHNELRAQREAANALRARAQVDALKALKLIEGEEE